MDQRDSRYDLRNGLHCSYVMLERLAALDTEGVPPTAHVIPLATPLREDSAVLPLDPEIAVANAPCAAGSAFVVPRVIEGEEEA